MVTGWDVLRKAFTPKKSLPTSEDIRAGAAKTLQPAVRAGERFRKEHPVAAQRISIQAQKATTTVRRPSETYAAVEKRVGARIPTLSQISQKGAAFRRSNPVAANALYTTFKKAHAQTERVGTITQRNALAGYTFGSYDSLQKQPVKTSALFAAGLVGGRALSVVGKVGKAFGAGTKAKRVAQAAQLGIFGYYGKTATDHIMSAPNSYVAGQRAANIMYTEILPMSAGIRVAAKPIKTKVSTTKKVSDAVKLKKSKPKPRKKSEFRVEKETRTKEQRLADAVKKSKPSFLRTLKGYTRKQYSSISLRISNKIRGKSSNISKKQLEKLQSELKIAANNYRQKRISALELRRRIRSIVKEFDKLEQEESQKIIKPVDIKISKIPKAGKSSQAKDMGKKFRKETAEKDAAVKRGELVEIQTKEGQILLQKVVQKQKLEVKTATKVKQKAKTEVKQATKTATKTKLEIKTATKAKIKTKTQQKTKLKVLVSLQRTTQSQLQTLITSQAQLQTSVKALQKTKPVPKQKQKVKAIALSLTRTATATITSVQTDIALITKTIAEQKQLLKQISNAIATIRALQIMAPIPPIKPKNTTKRKPVKKISKKTKLTQKNINYIATFRDLL